MALSLAEILATRRGLGAPEVTVKLPGKALRCLSCAHRCKIPEGRDGICRVRSNVGGELMVPRGYVAGVQVDPIEKKPFFHALPGNDALSFGMLGCDLHCAYCQNWVTSQALRDPVAGTGPTDVTPKHLVEIALREKAPVVVSTYNEPLITSEWAVEVLKPATEAGLLGAFVSNGNATAEVLDFIRPYVSLYKIDLKSFDDKRYRELGAPLEHILEGIRLVHAKGFWLEIVTLVIPGFNDSEAELREAARFIRSVSPDIPWHVTGFHDDYKMDAQGDTPARTLIRAAEIGVEEGLRFVYAGNRPGQVGEWEDTRCPSCRKTLIRRRSFKILECTIGRDGACPGCGTRVPGVWDHPLAARRPSSAPATPRRVS
ncbi:MAG: AmmeMemoRadiSam system radical SAM enzyme [Planctomycetota bacterium]